MPHALRLTLAALTALSLYGQAAETLPADKKKAIQELISVNKTRESAPQIIEQMVAQAGSAVRMQILQQIARHPTMTAEQKNAAQAKLDKELPNMQADMRAALQKANLPTLLEEISYEVYGKHFETREIRELSAFYRTPTGQKTLRVMPQVSGENMRALMQRLMPIMREQMQISGQRLQQQLDSSTKP